jgi:hypothetical protein
MTKDVPEDKVIGLIKSALASLERGVGQEEPGMSVFFFFFFFF